MKTSTPLRNIRQLCCLGLGGQAMMPALFEGVQKIVPSHFQIFFWAGENYNVTNMFCLNLPSVVHIAKLYLSEFVNKREREIKPPFSELMRTERGLIDWNRFMCHKFFKSDYYNEILKPLEARHILGTVIHEHNRALGELVIWRAPHERPFSTKERQLLLCLAPYIAHGLNARPNNDQPYIDSGNHGLVVTNQDGEIQYATPHGRELLFWATHPQISLSTVKSQPPPAPPLLAELCKNLVSTFQGESQPAPVKYHINPWGRFCFRAYWLEDLQYSRNALIAVTIELHEPLSLTLFSRMQAHGLSPRQKEVCQLLARRYAYPRIAKQLNISVHTLIDYVRRIYEKLEVHSHEELLEKLGILTGAKMDPHAIQLLRRHEGN